MAKNYRGKNIRKPGWRGTCQTCKREAVKVLWTTTDKDDNELKICKICNSKIEPTD
ncbi:hypothetical protein R9X47_27680 [Wukongibacter baidiensis]|uniref:hypothetical protein n=1 Tax=Wukongibacter baidiensis TaxID=1723361 RepID=UPI003D7FA02A